MLDQPARRVLRPALSAVAGRLGAAGVRPDHLTAAALVLALAAAFLAATGGTWSAAALWLASRLLDGLDGELARSLPADVHDRDVGGYLDIMGDFAAYAAVPAGVAVAVPEARLAIVFLLATYYLNGSAFLAFSSIAERRGVRTDDRSLQFLGGIAEGFETIAVHTALLLWPAAARPIAWVFAAVVGVTAIGRVAVGRRLLIAGPDPADEPRPAPGGPGASSEA